MVAIFAALAVIGFIAIIIVAKVLPSDDYYKDEPVDKDIVFSRMYVDVVWHADRSCDVEQEIEAEMLERGKHGIVVDLPVNSGEKIRSLNVSATGGGHELPYEIERENGYDIIRIRIGDEYRTLSRGDVLKTKITYTMITPAHPEGDNILDINPIGYGWASVIEDARVTVTYPEAPLTDPGISVWVGEEEAPSRWVTVSEGGKKITVRANDLEPFCGIGVKSYMREGLLEARADTDMILTVVIGLALFAAVVVLMLFYGREKPLTPVVDYYPPRIDAADGKKRHMLPVQMGVLIDGSCSGSDVTSLIFYWASEGYIRIEEREDGTYLKKLKEVEPVRDYEKQMFDRLFAGKPCGEDGCPEVSVSSLEGKFGATVAATKRRAGAEYSGKLYSRGSQALSIFLTLCFAVYGVLFAMLTSLRIGSWVINFAGILVVLPVILSAVCGAMLARNYLKFTPIKRKLFLALLFAGTALFSVVVMFSIPTDVMGWTEKMIFALCMGFGSSIAPFLTKRTAFYNEQLNSILGFREFLRDAEKERLELLLADDPQYYYNILPYANVLGVSDIWKNKFEGMTIEPPTYYSGGNIGLFDIFILHRLSLSLSRSLSYVPPKVNVGSLSGKNFRGGGGGGGFGGFGGGGGRSW